MAWPTDDLTKVHLDSGADDPSQARAELEALLDKTKLMLAEAVALKDELSNFTGGLQIGGIPVAASGANSDITSITGLTADLAVAHGGTGASSAAAARSNLSAAELGANTDITSIGGLTGAGSLSNYEEGTFTPTLQDISDSDAEGQTYSLQEGVYTRIGNTVFFDVNLTVTSLGTLSGFAQIAHLPFTSGTGLTLGAVASVRATGLNISANQTVTASIPPSDTIIVLALWDSAGGVSALSNAEVSATGSLRVSGSYQV